MRPTLCHFRFALTGEPLCLVGVCRATPRAMTNFPAMTTELASSSAIPNVLAERYASPAMKDIWSPAGRIAIERDFWIAVMKAQRDLGVAIPAEAIADYERVKDKIDLVSIAARERKTLHDVKARIEEFSDLAGRQFIHLGLTSRDLTENVEQLQIFRSLQVVRMKTAAALLALSKRAAAHRDLMLTGRTHNVPAQPTTLGKRIAMFGQEMLVAYTRLDELVERYPVRGLKGAVGTQQGGGFESVQAQHKRIDQCQDHLRKTVVVMAAGIVQAAMQPVPQCSTRRNSWKTNTPP